MASCLLGGDRDSRDGTAHSPRCRAGGAQGRRPVAGDSAGRPGTGALLAEYTVYLAAAYASLPLQLTDTLRATRLLRRILIGALVLVSAFWATAVVAEQRGNAVAQAIEASLPVQPEAVVYSSQRLQITGPGITETRLSGTDAAFVFR